MRNGTSEVLGTYVVPGSGQDRGARPPKGGLDDPMVPAGPPPAPWRFGCRPPGVEPRGRGPRHPAPRPSPEGARGRGGRAAFFHRPRPRQRSLTNAHSSKKVTASPALQLAVGAPTALAALTGLGAPLPAPQGARAPRAQNVRRSRVRSVTPPTGARRRGRRAEGGTGPSGTRAPTGECVWDPQPRLLASSVSVLPTPRPHLGGLGTLGLSLPFRPGVSLVARRPASSRSPDCPRRRRPCLSQLCPRDRDRGREREE